MLNSTLPVQDEERAEKHIVRELIPLTRETYIRAHLVFCGTNFDEAITVETYLPLRHPMLNDRALHRGQGL